MTVEQLKASLREGDCVFPGGYRKLYLCSDGAVLLPKTVRDNLREIFHAMRYEPRNGWAVVAPFIHWEGDPLFDAHTGEEIESEYGPIEDDS